MKKDIISILTISLILVAFVYAQPKVQQLNSGKLKSAIENNKFTFVYFYSASY